MSKARNLADVISGAYDLPVEALDNARIQVGIESEKPESPTEGLVFYNTERSRLEYYNGSEWTAAGVVIDSTGLSGDLISGFSSNITLDISDFKNPVSVEFYEGNTLLATQTGLTASNNQVTAAVPSTVYNRPGGTQIKVRAVSANKSKSDFQTLTSASPTITGGTKTVVNGVTYHAFTSSDTFSTNVDLTGVELLLVGAGGSGGTGSYGGGANYNGGAGGGGGIVHLTNQTISIGDHSVVIGAGGAGVAPSNQAGNNGSSTTAFNQTAGGGLKNNGMGGGASGSPQSNSGGGAGSYSGGGGGGAGGSGVGGGANAKKAGGVGLQFTNFSQFGAEAQTSTITATPTPNGYFGGGGQGAGAANPSARAAGGGGAAGQNGSVNALNAGVANTGGGGSGGYAQNEYSGNGGSGIVLIRYGT